MSRLPVLSFAGIVFKPAPVKGKPAVVCRVKLPDLRL